LVNEKHWWETGGREESVGRVFVTLVHSCGISEIPKRRVRARAW
jgi:hypothetical protein